MGFVEQGIDVGEAENGMEFGGGKASTLEVPGGFDGALEDDFLERAVGDQRGAEVGFELGEGVLLAGEGDESFGCQLMGCGLREAVTFPWRGWRRVDVRLPWWFSFEFRVDLRKAEWISALTDFVIAGVGREGLSSFSRGEARLCCFCEEDWKIYFPAL